MKFHDPSKRRAGATLACLVSASLMLTSCATDEEAAGLVGGSGVSVDQALATAAANKAAQLTAGIDLDASIEVVGANSGTEGAVLQAMYKSFTDGTGVAVNYTGTSDAPTIAEARLQSGNPVDVLSTQIGVMSRYAQQGKLVNLSSYMEDELDKNYSPTLLDSIRVNGAVHGVFQGFNNFMMWFNPTVYQGPRGGSQGSSATWDEVTAWADDAAQSGSTPWCLPMEAGTATGFPGRQLVEVMLLKKYGPDVYHKLGSGELSWTSPEVKDAFEMLGEVALDPAKILGGPKGALSSPTSTGDAGLITDPPDCQATVWGSWTAGLVGATGTVEPGANLDFMPVPPSNPEYSTYENYQAELMGAFKDTPTIRAFLEYVQSTEAQALLASADQWTVSNVNVPASTYDSPLLARAAEYYFGTDVDLVTGPNVMMTTAVKNAVQSGVVAYLTDPSQLDATLAKIQAAQNGSR